MTDEERAIADDLLQRALNGTDHSDKAVSVLMTAGMTILQRRFGAERSLEVMTAALDVAGGEVRRSMYGATSRS